MKTFLGVILAACFGVILCEPIKFQPCDSPAGHINSLDVTPCHSFPCEFPSGVEASVKLNFTSKVNTKYVRAVVHGYVLGIPVSFPLPQPLACKTGVTCPVKAAATNLYENTLPVSKSYPRIKVGVKWELQDDKGVNIACFKIPVQIV